MAGWLLISSASCKTEYILPQQEQVTDLPDKNSIATEVTTKSINVLRGYVNDLSGSVPLPGAIITIKNTRFSAVTNKWGRFELVLPENYAIKEATLVINYIGYKTQQIPCFKVATGTPSFYLAEDDTMLGEVVIVGKINTKKER